MPHLSTVSGGARAFDASRPPPLGTLIRLWITSHARLTMTAGARFPSATAKLPDRARDARPKGLAGTAGSGHRSRAWRMPAPPAGRAARARRNATSRSHDVGSSFLAALPRRFPRRAHAAAVQHLDPSARRRRLGGRLPAARAEPLRPAMGEGALLRPDRRTRRGRRGPGGPHRSRHRRHRSGAIAQRRRERRAASAPPAARAPRPGARGKRARGHAASAASTRRA